MSHLLFFYGTECPHCEHALPLLAELEKKENITVEHLEVWHDQDNLKRLEHCDKDDACGGVPYFYNEQTGKWLCGEVSYDELVIWAKGK